MLDRSTLIRAARKFGTPTYLYDAKKIQTQCRTLRKAFPTFELHYAMKANSNPALLELIQNEGFGTEAVSRGELVMAHRTGFARRNTSFTSSAMTEEEMRHAAKFAGRVHLDSLTQIEMWGRLELGKRISLRINHGIGAGHHSHVITGGPDSKFGITLADLPKAKKLATRHDLTIKGLQQHIGSNVLDHKIFLLAARALLATATDFPDVSHIDFGGGFGIPYRPNEKELDIEALGTHMTRLVRAFEKERGRTMTFALEPGRYLVAQAGIFLVEVTDRKATAKHSFIAVNSGFNHLVRPAMYDAYHEIQNVSRSGPRMNATISGNICESGDILGKGRRLATPRIGDVLAIANAGAYGFSMASAYNLRRLPAEVLVSGQGLKDISFKPSDFLR